jgi:hypothetical protein
MDLELQQKIDEAKQAGYSDEDIQLYLNTKNETAPQDKPINRYEEQVGTYTSAVPESIKLGLEGAGLYGLYKGAQNIFGNKNAGPVAPPLNPTPSMSSTSSMPLSGEPPATMGNATWDAAMKRPVPPGPPTGTVDYATKLVKSLALNKLMPAMAAAQVAANTYLTSPDEIATLKAAEAKKRAQGWKPLNER